LTVREFYRCYGVLL